jgi:hypothetical protein
MTSSWTYRQDQELPAFAVDWRDRDNRVIDFTSGYTFEVKLAASDSADPVIVKTDGVVGASTAPNLTVVWASGELDVEPGKYRVFIKASNGEGDRRFAPGAEPHITILPAPADAGS